MTLSVRRIAAATLSAAFLLSCPGAAMAQTPPGPPDPAAPPRDPSARPPAAVPATGSIRGRVVAADTGLPLRRVTVSLYSTGEERGQGADTDADGAFTFEAVPKGRYRLKASKARYVDTAPGARVPGGRGRAFDLADGQKIENLTIGLALAGVITGRVLDDAGEPVAGAQVMAVQRKGPKGVPRPPQSAYGGSTDDTGTYRLFGLPPGRYYLSVRPDERSRGRPGVVHTSPTSLAVTYFPSTPVASEAQPIEVAAGTEMMADIALVARQVTTVSGEVVDAAGRAPIAGVLHLVTAGGDGAGRDFVGMQTMNKTGVFTLSGVAPGDYTLLVRAFFDESALLKMFGAGNVEEEAFTMPLSVSTAPIADLRIVVTPPVDVRGRMRFEGEPPPVGATFVATTAVNGGEIHSWSRAPVGADGQFTLRVRPGRWSIAALSPSRWMLKRLFVRGRAVDPAEPVELTGDPDERLEILLTSQLTVVTGTARDANGVPLRDFHAVLFPAKTSDMPSYANRARFERADAEGRFRFEGLQPGDYLVAAVVDLDPEDGDLEEELLDAIRPEATPLRVTEGRAETINVKLASLP